MRFHRNYHSKDQKFYHHVIWVLIVSKRKTNIRKLKLIYPDETYFIATKNFNVSYTEIEYFKGVYISIYQI